MTNKELRELVKAEGLEYVLTTMAFDWQTLKDKQLLMDCFEFVKLSERIRDKLGINQA